MKLRVRPAATHAPGAPGREEVVLGEMSGLYSTALSLGMAPAEAEERVAEAVAVAWRTTSARGGEGDLRVALYRGLLDLRAGAWERSASAALDQARPAPVHVSATAVEVADALDAERVRELVCSLPDELAVVLLLADVAGLSYEEVAATLGLSGDAVASRLSAARRALESGIVASLTAVK